MAATCRIPFSTWPNKPELPTRAEMTPRPWSAKVWRKFGSKLDKMVLFLIFRRCFAITSTNALYVSMPVLDYPWYLPLPLPSAVHSFFAAGPCIC
jgi:hypothetical protein